MLEVTGLNVWYHKSPVLTDVSLSIGEGTFVTLIGPNGSGKTTLLRSIVNLHDRKSGRIEFLGEDITRKPAYRIMSRDLAYVPDYRGILRTLKVRENLQVMSIRYNDKQSFREALESVLEFFPHLRKRYESSASLLSGGEQQMLAIARALLVKPRLLIIDEPSIGLAPLLVRDIFGRLKGLTVAGMSVFMVEQNVVRSLEYSDYCYVVEKGRVVLEGPSRELAAMDDLKEKYFGGGGVRKEGPGTPA